jgi:hypothetical protein
VMPRSDVPAVTPLLEQLLDHPQGYPEAMSYLVPRRLSFVIRRSFAPTRASRRVAR